MVTATTKKKIEDPMFLWEQYWEASGESFSVEVLMYPGETDERLAKILKTSPFVIHMARQIDSRTANVFFAKTLRRKLAEQLLDHYRCVARHLAIEKAKQTGEDFGEYMALAEDTLRSTIPRWQQGKAPFANYCNPRIKWAFFDERIKGHWDRAVELTDDILQSEPAELPLVPVVAGAIDRLPFEEWEVVTRTFQRRQSPSEIAEELSVNKKGPDKVAEGKVRSLLSSAFEALRRDEAIQSLQSIFGENYG